MQGNRVVTIIPQKKKAKIDPAGQEIRKRRVAGYARVSTEQEQQQNSYQTQLDYYTAYINARPDWEFAGMYSDEGITGTSTKRREGFNRMVEDALAGKIDLIVTKSVSRFARNTVDSLSTVRKLKDAGVEVYFEKENIYTLDQKGELLITIMSSLAQEESRSISENTTWGQRKRMADGHGCLGFSHFMGYDRGPDGEFVINEEQAKIVRRIYSEYIDGRNTSQIAKGLTEDGIKTVTGKDKWSPSSILSILHNEKYKGDCLMQKYYVGDFLTKKRVRNQGELQQYYVKGHHEPIVTEEVYRAAQQRLDANRAKYSQSGVRDFSSMIVCGDCGAFYGSKVWHSNDKYRKVVYRCNRKYSGEKCATPSINEKRLEEMFVEAINKLLGNRDEIIENIEQLLAIKTEAKDDAAIREAAVALDRAETAYRALIERQKTNPQEFTKYEKEIKEAGKNYDEAKERYDAALDESRNRERSVYEIERFLESLRTREGAVESYDSGLMKRTLRQITVYHDGRAVFAFFDGSVVDITI